MFKATLGNFDMAIIQEINNVKHAKLSKLIFKNLIFPKCQIQWGTSENQEI